MISRLVLAILALVAAVWSQSMNPKDIITLKYINENYPDGYFFEYELSDGTTRIERGYLTDQGTEEESLVVTGMVSWIAENKRYTLTFTADKDGYRPSIYTYDSNQMQEVLFR